MKVNQVIIIQTVPLSDLATRCPEDDLARNQKQLPIRTGDFVFYCGELATCGADYLTQDDAKDGIFIITHKTEVVVDKEEAPAPTSLKQIIKKIIKFKK